MRVSSSQLRSRLGNDAAQTVMLAAAAAASASAAPLEPPPISLLELERLLRRPYWESGASDRHVFMAPSVPGEAVTSFVESTPAAAPRPPTLGDSVYAHGGWPMAPRPPQLFAHGGRPTAPMAPRGVNPLAGAIAPFYDPATSGAGVSADAMYSLAMPLMATMNRHGREPRPPDPNVIPAIATMVSKALPDQGKVSPLEAAVAYGGVIAGMGGVHGLRGHSLKRIHGVPAASADGVMDPADYPIFGDGSAYSGPGGVYPGPGSTPAGGGGGAPADDTAPGG